MSEDERKIDSLENLYYKDVCEYDRARQNLKDAYYRMKNTERVMINMNNVIYGR